MTPILLLLLAGSGRYFTHATIYDAQLGSLREDVYVLVDDAGVVTQVSRAPLPVAEGTTTEDACVLLPPLSDFYTLIQERGLGKDEDIEPANQARLARYLCRIGVRNLRDPVFPPLAVAPVVSDLLEVTACRGYLDLAGGPAAESALVVDPEQSLESLYQRLPERGPITLWWSGNATGKTVGWPQKRAFTSEMLAYFKSKGRTVGACIQDAGPAELAELASFEFDFYEGLPAAGADVSGWPERVVWVPLAALNDRRYCAWDLDGRLARMEGLGLYEERDHAQAVKAVDSIRDRISARCQIWREERANVLAPLLRWLELGRKLGLGSAGGHSYCFSGDLNAELAILEELGASQAQLLEAAFRTTPALLGVADQAYLVPGKPANFLVYRRRGHWGSLVGTKVDLQYQQGRELGGPLPSVLPGRPGAGLQP